MFEIPEFNHAPDCYTTYYQGADFQRQDSALDNKMIDNKFNYDPTANQKIGQWSNSKHTHKTIKLSLIDP